MSTLKEQNILRLTSVLAGNAVVFLAVINWPTELVYGIQYWKEYLLQLIPLSIGLALMTVVNGIITPHAKAQLVFWRIRNPLPGSRAFSEIAESDPRIDQSELRSRFAPFPDDEQAQNALWYKLYQSAKNDEAVLGGHKDFLFTRDYASLSALMVIPLVLLSIFFTKDMSLVVVYAAMLLIQYFVVRMVAETYGRRFVATVLAVASSN